MYTSFIIFILFLSTTVKSESEQLLNATINEKTEFEETITEIQNNTQVITTLDLDEITTSNYEEEIVNNTGDIVTDANYGIISTTEKLDDSKNENITNLSTIEEIEEDKQTATTDVNSTSDMIVKSNSSELIENNSNKDNNKKPFYHKTIDELVKVVESNILEEAVPEIEINTTEMITIENNKTDERLDRLSDQIRSIISYYQLYGDVTIPNADIPDPMDVPDVKKTFGGSPTTFTNMKLYGLSNFTISEINTDLQKMQVYISVKMKTLTIIGNYSIKSWLTRASGPFKVILRDVITQGSAELKKDDKGIIQASKSELDMSFNDADVDFKNLGLVGSILQSVLASVAPVLFEAIKPEVLKQINNRIRENLNNKLEQIGSRMIMTGARPPIDAAVQEGQLYIKENGYDPYEIKDYTFRQNVFAINITELVLEGLSKFQRVGEIVLFMTEGTVQMGAHVATRDLTGKCKWAVGIGRSFKKRGFTNFTIDHIQVKALVNQSIDVERRPVLDSLEINVGKVKIDMEGTGRFDIIVEVMINTLPDLIRHIFVDAIEVPLKYKLQQILNRIDPEIVLEKSLPELDNLGL